MSQTFSEVEVVAQALRDDFVIADLEWESQDASTGDPE